MFRNFFSVKRTTHMCIIKINKGANSNRFYIRLPVFADRFSGFDSRIVYSKIARDSIIMFCLEKKHSILKCEELLEKYKELSIINEK